jgi:polyisoprenoid-binding protein YceI
MYFLFLHEKFGSIKTFTQGKSMQNQKPMVFSWIVFAFWAALTVTAHAAPLKVDTTKSSVSAVFKQMGVPIETKFTKFSAQVDYDAAKPQNSKAIVDIDITSFDLGDPDYNQEVQKKEWFNGAQFPKANFTAGKITPSGAGKLEVSGKLTIKGKTADVSFFLNVKKEGAAQLFEGSLPIKRLAFSIGDGTWKDTSVVADEVIIKFRIVGTQ